MSSFVSGLNLLIKQLAMLQFQHLPLRLLSRKTLNRHEHVPSESTESTSLDLSTVKPYSSEIYPHLKGLCLEFFHLVETVLSLSC
jgi:hypothetical protein